MVLARIGSSVGLPTETDWPVRLIEADGDRSTYSARDRVLPAEKRTSRSFGRVAVMLKAGSQSR
jgi:hypothetical protein